MHKALHGLQRSMYYICWGVASRHASFLRGVLLDTSAWQMCQDTIKTIMSCRKRDQKEYQHHVHVYTIFRMKWYWMGLCVCVRARVCVCVFLRVYVCVWIQICGERERNTRLFGHIRAYIPAVYVDMYRSAS